MTKSEDSIFCSDEVSEGQCKIREAIASTSVSALPIFAEWVCLTEVESITQFKMGISNSLLAFNVLGIV